MTVLITNPCNPRPEYCDPQHSDFEFLNFPADPASGAHPPSGHRSLIIQSAFEDNGEGLDLRSVDEHIQDLQVSGH